MPETSADREVAGHDRTDGRRRRASRSASARSRRSPGSRVAAPTGGVLAVLGPNGAGKSTFVRMMATLTTPDAGSLHVAGVDALRHPDRVRVADRPGRPVRRRRGGDVGHREPRDGRPPVRLLAIATPSGGPPPCSSASTSSTPATASCGRGRAACAAASTSAPPSSARHASCCSTSRRRARPGQPHRAVGVRPRAGGRRHRRRAHDAVPRRGRPPRRPHRDHRPRPHDRRGLPRRAQGRGRPRRRRGPPARA